MANILLLDESDVAGRAFQGILARGNHRAFVATTAERAWRMLREGVVFDLVFLELKHSTTPGVTFLQRLREDWYWRIMPVVVYTSETDSRLVRRVLGLRVQNYLIKPYSDQAIYGEIAKALQNPWRDLHFEEAKSFCGLADISIETLTAMRRQVMVGFDEAAQTYPAWADGRKNDDLFAKTSALVRAAEEAGVWAGVDYLRDLQEQAAAGHWAAFRSCAEHLEFASRLIFCQLNPSYAPDCMLSEADLVQAKEAAERARWESADVDRNGPVIEAATLEARVKAVGGCPVIDTAAAAFQMLADGRAATMVQVVDLVSNDPGLAVQILSAANLCEHDEMTAIEDVRAGAGILGEVRLNALSRRLPIAYERHAHVPPFTWANYWKFQAGVARIARFVCTYLDFGYLAGTTYTAGLIHDIGRLLLLHLQPHAFAPIVRYARERKLPLATAERRYLGCTTRDLAARFADLGLLPPVYANVLRWVERPEQAEADTEVVAMVSLARHICIQTQIGTCGDPGTPARLALAATPAWRVLQSRVFPDVKSFEAQVHAQCQSLRAELNGHGLERRTANATRAPELV